jgi:hypothetical protein
MLLLHRAAVVFVLAAGAVAQTTWVVSGGGAALQTAINAAAAGDTLDIQPGSYDSAVCSKGLRIATQPGVQIGNSVPGLSIVNLPQAERFQVDGGGIVISFGATGCAGTIVVDGVDVQGTEQDQLQGCTGPIVFDGVRYLGGFSSSSVGHVQCTSCTDLTFRDCALPRLGFAATRAVLQGCTVRPYTMYGQGVRVVSGTVTVSGGYVTGSQAWHLAVPMAAIRLDGGELALTGGATIAALVWPIGTPAAGIEANGGTIRLDPSVTVTGTPPILGPATVLTTPIASLVVTHTATTMNVAVRGRPNDIVFTFAGLGAAPYPTPWGDAWLLPTDPILDIVVMPPSGTSSFSSGFASVPPFVLLTLQPVAIEPWVGLTLGAPTRFVWN